MDIHKNPLFSAWIAFTGGVIIIIILATSSPVSAQESPPVPENGSCVNCHEDLYFLHDTGNWFCLRESPMRCVDCHGGNPNAITQEEAHLNRKAHPVVNEDISKCQECHPAECMERIEKFNQTAGIRAVQVVVPYQPKPGLPIQDAQAESLAEPVAHPAWISIMEIFPLILTAGIALVIYYAHKAQQKIK